MPASPDHDGATLSGGGWSQAPCCRHRQEVMHLRHRRAPAVEKCRDSDERSERLLCTSDNADEQQQQSLLPRHLPMMVQTTQANLPPALLSPRLMTARQHLRQPATTCARLSSWSMQGLEKGFFLCPSGRVLVRNGRLLCPSWTENCNVKFVVF